MNYLEFEVIWGVNNIYSILELNSKLIYEGIFKGKVLETGCKEYSPLVPGDIVLGYIYSSRKVYIDKRLSRKIFFGVTIRKQILDRQLFLILIMF